MWRTVGLAVAGSALVTAGLAALVLGAAGQIGPAGRAELAGLGLVAAGALCGLAMMVTVLRAGRARRPAAASGPDAAGRPAAPPAAPGAAPRPPEPAPQLPVRPPEPAPQLPVRPPEPAPQRPSRPAPEWAHEPAADWAPEPGPVPMAGPPVPGPPVPGLAGTPDGQAAGPPRAGWGPASEPAVDWHPDSEEDWLRVLRGLRNSEPGHED